jgi:hypothetical protein
VIDIDATLVGAHSEKEQAAPTYKRGFGFHPLLAYLDATGEALYRGRGRAERQICDTKTLGLANLPSHSFAINTTWMHLVLTAHDLLAWTRALVLDGDLATAEPKRLRYCLFHTAGHLITTGRRRICRLSNTWPWTDQLIDAFTRVHTLPLRI